jgi:hypothetical protein
MNYNLRIVYKNGCESNISQIPKEEIKDTLKTMSKGINTSSLITLIHKDNFFLIDGQDISSVSFEKIESSDLFLDNITKNKKQKQVKFNATIESIDEENEENDNFTNLLEVKPTTKLIGEDIK